ncbi:alpha/beta hydrolase [Variovorax saccharolyticus]|uniref:alpha/beta hydrolase n=1 Tax=Variovorax saccharolyticus TaxID=3053516 RepID=UPI00257509D1|nr:alpha/beta hydrolase [Variovorax sp. J31P216]MDM0028473.1 alpha/beta hydrolase [Variovorax sp. J31P216]
MGLPPVIFSHGNSFPASTYRVMLDSLRNRGFEIDAIEKFGHDPKYPVTDNWPHLVQQLADFARQRSERAGSPVLLVGHSLGGFLSLMCAALHPGLAKGVVLLDSPIIGGWRAGTINLMKRTPLMKSVTPGMISRKRRNSWEHREAVFEHFRSKKAFARWDERVLRDYIEHGTFDLDDASDARPNSRALSFDRDVETAIYETIPHNLGALLRAHPLKCPAAFVGGRQSVEMKRVGMTMTQQVTKGRIMMLDGTHLFPMEKPIATAAAVEAALRNLLA